MELKLTGILTLEPGILKALKVIEFLCCFETIICSFTNLNITVKNMN